MVNFFAWLTPNNAEVPCGPASSSAAPNPRATCYPKHLTPPTKKTEQYQDTNKESEHGSRVGSNTLKGLVGQYVNFGWSSVPSDTYAVFCSAITQNCFENSQWPAVIFNSAKHLMLPQLISVLNYYFALLFFSTPHSTNEVHV